MSQQNKIILDVQLDEDKIPETIEWAAGGEEKRRTRAFFLSLFDPDRRDTLKIDLWTKDMSVEDMHVHMYNTIKSMGRSYARAIGKEDVIDQFDQLADSLVEEAKE